MLALQVSPTSPSVLPAHQGLALRPRLVCLAVLLKFFVHRMRLYGGWASLESVAPLHEQPEPTPPGMTFETDRMTAQDNCKRDAESYRGEFELQRQHYAALLQVLKLKPEQRSPELGGLVSFLAHVSKSYPAELQDYPMQLSDVLETHGATMQPQLRGQMVQALILMRRRGIVSSQALLPLCFRLFECHDKALRATLHGFIIADVRSFNAGGRNDRLNRSIQNYLYKLIEVRGKRWATYRSRAAVCKTLCVTQHLALLVSTAAR